MHEFFGYTFIGRVGLHPNFAIRFDVEVHKQVFDAIIVQPADAHELKVVVFAVGNDLILQFPGIRVQMFLRMVLKECNHNILVGFDLFA